MDGQGSFRRPVFWTAKDVSDVAGTFGISRRPATRSCRSLPRQGLKRSAIARRPVGVPTSCPTPIERMSCGFKKDKPHWGARKIRELLVRKLDSDVRIPARSTVHAVLDRHGLVAHAHRRRRFKAEGTELSQALLPNDLWCTDFKGEFKLGNGRYCYRSTVSDQASRYLLACEALDREGSAVIQDLCATVQGARPANRHTLRQRPALRLAQRPLQTLQALSLLAQAWHCHRAHPARQSSAGMAGHERMRRTLEGRDNPAGRRQHPSAAGLLRHLRQGIQYSAAARGDRHEGASRPVRTLFKSLCRLAGLALPFPRPRHSRHQLRSHLHASQRGSTSRTCSPVKIRNQGSQIDDSIWLVSFMRQISAISIWNRGPCRPSTMRSAQIVTHVLGSNCYLCLRVVVSRPVWSDPRACNLLEKSTVCRKVRPAPFPTCSEGWANPFHRCGRPKRPRRCWASAATRWAAPRLPMTEQGVRAVVMVTVAATLPLRHVDEALDQRRRQDLDAGRDLGARDRARADTTGTMSTLFRQAADREEVGGLSLSKITPLASVASASISTVFMKIGHCCSPAGSRLLILPFRPTGPRSAG